MATVDTSIYNTPRKSAFEYLQEMDAADAAKQAKESNRLALLIQQGQYQDQTQARARGNQLRTALQGLGAGATEDQRIGLLESHGEFGQADTLRKGVLDRQRTAAQVEKDTAAAEQERQKTAYLRLDRQLQSLAMVANPQQMQQWVGQGVQSGMFTPEQAQSVMASMGRTPQEFEAARVRLMQGGMSVKEQIEQRLKEAQFGEAQRHNKAQEGLTARGQNMTDSRAREGLAQSESQFNRKLAAEGDKPLNDVQSKALLFGSRMQEADKVIGKLITGGTKTPSLIKQAAESVPGIGGALGMAANATVASDSQQQMEQAQRDFINATLRRESGAVISEAEFENARKQYFPQPGDSPAVMAQKAKNRTLATKGILAEVPERKRSSLSEPSTGGATGSWGEGWKIEKAQ